MRGLYACLGFEWTITRNFCTKILYAFHFSHISASYFPIHFRITRSPAILNDEVPRLIAQFISLLHSH